MNVLAELRSRFEPVLQPLADDPAPYVAMVKPAGDARFGDFQANCAMPLAQRAKTNPRELATQIASQLDLADLCQEPEVAGPGFINLRLKDEWIAGQINSLVGDDCLGVAATDSPRNVVVDFSSPNVAKPMHVGHLRSTVIGDALYRMLQFVGHRVVSDNHIGDWGTQFGMIIFGYKHFLDEDAYRRDSVGELARLYRLVNQLSDYHDQKVELPNRRERLERLEAEIVQKESQADPKDKQAKKAIGKLREDVKEADEQITAAEKSIAAVEGNPQLKALAEAHPNIAVAAREETARLHAGDAENRRLWELFLPQCLDALQALYDRLGIRFDMALGESFYDSLLSEFVEDLRSKQIAEDSEGAVCVFIDKEKAPFIVRKSDGAFTYATTDLATIKYRIDELQADEMLYVVDARQADHFKLLFETAARWGYSADYRHVSFGTILGDDRRPFRTRAGDTVGLESLLDEAVARARRIVDENDDAKETGPELDDAARTRIAEVVGIGGIKYADLRHNRDSDYIFNWEKMLATNGDTATYMQYAYARVCGIFRKGQVDREALRASGGTIELTTPEERALALQLLRFADTIDEALQDYRPNVLTSYLFETAKCYSTFFDKCPVLKAESETLRTSRLLLCDLTARVIEKGLSLLGIETAEQM